MSAPFATTAADWVEGTRACGNEGWSTVAGAQHEDRVGLIFADVRARFGLGGDAVAASVTLNASPGLVAGCNKDLVLATFTDADKTWRNTESTGLSGEDTSEVGSGRGAADRTEASILTDGKWRATVSQHRPEVDIIWSGQAHVPLLHAQLSPQQRFFCS